MTQPNDIIAMARAAKSFYAAAAEDDTPPPSDELFVRAAVAFSMLMRMGFPVMPEMAVIVPDLDAMNRDHAICTIALSFADHPPSTNGRADLFATVLPDDYAQALQDAVEGNRRVLGMPPQSGDVMTIARFDYAGTPPRGRSWAAFKLSHDPPGLRTASYGGSVFWVHVTVGAEHPVEGPFSAAACGGAWPVQSEQAEASARAAAWAWYDRRLALVKKLMLTMPSSARVRTPFWPRCLAWSDEHVSEVERWLVDSTAEMPEVLRG